MKYVRQFLIILVISLSLIHIYKYYISYFHENTEKLLVLVKDVTNTTRLEDEKRLELEAALLQAKKANDAKKAFLSNMSHDIRTPINVDVYKRQSL